MPECADTVMKLSDFQIHVVSLGEDGKLDSTDAVTPALLADDTIACVSSIGR